MNFRLLAVFAIPVLAYGPGCSADQPTDQLTGGTAGDPGTGGAVSAGTKGSAAGNAGADAGTGGTAMPMAGTGGASAGGGRPAGGQPGTAGKGGGAGVGGTSTSAGTGGGGGAGGMSGGRGGGIGSGGMPAAGAAGSAGSPMGGTGGTSSTAAMPSMGCGKGGRPASDVTVSGDHIYTFPADYDGMKPFPLTFGFHGAGNSDTSFRSTDAKTKTVGDFEKTYVMAYVKSAGNDWTGQLQTNFTKFDTVFTQVTTTYCIDLNRVFAIGHSSGAQFISNLVCRPENRLKAVGPVASSDYNGNCRKIPVMAIQGAMDSVRNSNGASWIEAFASRNGCMNPTMTPTTAWDEPNCQSYAGSTMVTPNCKEWQGCMDPNRTVWCSHNDPNYNGGTNHGWPCFANDALYKFFASIP